MRWLPNNWKPKAVAVDIDGTITDSNKRIHLGAIKALRDLEKSGIPVIIATGNVRGVTYGLWRFIGASGPMVCENGGVVWHPDWDKPIIRASGERAKDAAKHISNIIDIDANGINTNDWRESEWCLFPDEDLESIIKIIEESEFRDLSVVKTGFAIHLMEPHLSKGSGLLVALEKFGLSAEDVLAVGDAPNDIPMFQIVGHSVAVGGCFDELANVASVVSPHHRGDTFEPLVREILSD
ncbi:MAG: phosphoglycolate phosphatase [Euryarchaeota archaeon]|nr:phosphoglycolate phosphatase [Euryarchaeota archaeon]|tara:strand:+ start:2401 stop:3114 length:714 start_codon:yes stop_codon:yes gene_type:complete